MQRLLIPLTFFQSLATVLLERGLYFYTDEILKFSEAENLGLAIVFGVCYASGAMLSHKVTKKRGERPTLQSLMIGLCMLNMTVALMPTPLIVWSGFAGIGLLIGMKWPVIESYVTAGATPDRTLKVIGRFNMAWSSAMPFALALTGVMIEWLPPSSFIMLAGAIYLFTLPVILQLPWVPEHLPHDHPERPDPRRVRRYRALMNSSRWSLIGTCAMMFLLVPLMPSIFDRLGHGVLWAPALSSVLDVGRFLTFVALGIWTFWRGRSLPLAVSAIGVPTGFLMVLFAPTTAVAIGGELIFGFCGGQVYFAALYHAMVLENASVEAGGHHEALIGSGFALGPAIGLAGIGLQRVVGDPVGGMLIAVAPLVLLCLAASLWPLIKLRREERLDPAPSQDAAQALQ
ncbi:MFS transporter [Algisphaera agarilytica]|uniref:MFS family permease n=1 Tax=Algisphaera agarilytica TaxID=1385975 RepID=A0A7X0LLH8_9BACT|nr:MFS transporter [Algisphaera agarilytica]MBB6431520.1 MFS family permease [Algisphaera agarilytica]